MQKRIVRMEMAWVENLTPCSTWLATSRDRLGESAVQDLSQASPRTRAATRIGTAGAFRFPSRPDSPAS
jgi:hypothetical protein